MDRQRPDIGCNYTLVNLDPALSIVGRAVDSTAITNEICTGENRSVRSDYE